jgi:glycosyltransferase involved in cell wall biosynthesis
MLVMHRYDRAATSRHALVPTRLAPMERQPGAPSVAAVAIRTNGVPHRAMPASRALTHVPERVVADALVTRFVEASPARVLVTSLADDALPALAPAPTPLAPPADRPRHLFAAVSSLALGGAERIVLDWAARNAKRHRVRLLVTGRAAEEWTAPEGVHVVRAARTDHAMLGLFGRAAQLAGAGVLAHLLRREERQAIAAGGATVIPVIHNAPEGWLEPASALADAPFVIAVSDATASALRDAGVDRPIGVIRHVPTVPERSPALGRHLRAQWRLPEGAFVIGMLGGVKPQKAYPRALRILAALLEHREAFLVIVGGPAGREGDIAMDALRAQVDRLSLRPFVRLAGFVPDAARLLSAFDVLLNTSTHEGFSIATAEALASGLPVVASAVGGQGELRAPGLNLVREDLPTEAWVDALQRVAGTTPPVPNWARFPTHRLWTLAGLAAPGAARPGAPAPVSTFVPGRIAPCVARPVVFVTANLDVGGAQRSLVNLCESLQGRFRFDVAVTGGGDWPGFLRRLESAGVTVVGPTPVNDVFEQAEMVLAHATAIDAGTLCFWNVDPRLKLLLARFGKLRGLRIVDVSPGADAFDEIAAAEGFGAIAGAPVDGFFRELDVLVHKHETRSDLVDQAREIVIPNGVPTPANVRRHWGLPPGPRIVVSGRIAPSKFLHEIVAAMCLVWERRPDCELHLYGPFDRRNRDYGESVRRLLSPDMFGRAWLHGAHEDVPERLADYDLFVVLGRNQGCPNALLEAMAAGLPVIANDSGGTREIVKDGETGLLVDGCAPAPLAAAMLKLLADRDLARRLATNGRRHVETHFSMAAMADAYERLFAAGSPDA